MLTWTIVAVSLASVALAHHMAHARGRSPRSWCWIAILVGPLAPLMLLILGKHADEIPGELGHG